MENCIVWTFFKGFIEVYPPNRPFFTIFEISKNGRFRHFTNSCHSYFSFIFLQFVCGAVVALDQNQKKKQKLTPSRFYEQSIHMKRRGEHSNGFLGQREAMPHCLAIFRDYTSTVLGFKETENMDRLSGDIGQSQSCWV